MHHWYPPARRSFRPSWRLSQKPASLAPFPEIVDFGSSKKVPIAKGCLRWVADPADLSTQYTGHPSTQDENTRSALEGLRHSMRKWNSSMIFVRCRNTSRKHNVWPKQRGNSTRIWPTSLAGRTTKNFQTLNHMGKILIIGRVACGPSCPPDSPCPALIESSSNYANGTQ